MTPVPFELPLRASEAAAIADVLFQQVEGRPLTDDQRGRFAGRLASIETPSITVYPGSLAADPIHPSTYYLAVDGTRDGVTTSLLLRIGLASSPGTGLFPKSLMIGRMRPNGQREVVVSAITFAAGDQEHIRTFAELVDKTFLPKPHGAQPALTVRTTDPAAAFDALKQLPRHTAAALEVPAEDFWPTVRAAIRAGRREAYSLGLVLDLAAGRDAALAQVEQAPLFTKYAVAVTAEAQAADAAAVFHHVRRAKAGLSSLYTRTVDFELLVSDAALAAPVLAALRAEGHTVPLLTAPAPAADLPAGVRLTQRLTATPGLDLREAVATFVRA